MSCLQWQAGVAHCMLMLTQQCESACMYMHARFEGITTYCQVRLYELQALIVLSQSSMPQSFFHDSWLISKHLLVFFVSDPVLLTHLLSYVHLSRLSNLPQIN